MALVVGWMLGGAVALGVLLDALSNAVAFFTPERALVGSVVTVAFWGAVELWARRRGIRWVIAGQALVVRRLGLRHWFGLLGVLGLLWIPSVFTGRGPAPSAPVEIGSTYHSDLPRLLFDPPRAVPGLPFHSVLTLRNIAQATLVHVSVRVLKATLAGPRIDFIHPYLPPKHAEGFYTGSSPGVLLPSGEQKPHLLPGESMTIDFARYVDATERAMLMSTPAQSLRS